MTLSRNGIAYNFHSSPYQLKVTYDSFDLIFRFSSANNVQKFLNKMYENRDKVNLSLSKRFKINLVLNVIADIKLYSNVETRGFLIIGKDETFECLEEVEFDGLRMMKKNLQD